MANLFNKTKTAVPRQTIKSQDFNDLQDALVTAFNRFGEEAPAGKKGVSTEFHVADATEPDSAVTKRQHDEGVSAVSANAQQVATDAAQVAANKASVDTSETAVVAIQADVNNKQTDVTTKHDNVVSKHTAVVAAQSDVANRQSDVATKHSETVAARDAAESHRDAASASASTASSAATAATGAALSAESDSTVATQKANEASASATAASASETAAALSASSVANVGSGSRNQAVNQEPLSQGKAQRAGFAAAKYSGTDVNLSVNAGVDMATGELGGLVWLKGRNAVSNHGLFDSIRGAGNVLFSNLADAEGSLGAAGISLTSSGFDTGSWIFSNTNNNTYVAWAFQTTKRTSGLTNRNKPYTCHYNPDFGFSIIKHGGDGEDGHEVYHHLPKEPDLLISKRLDGAGDWFVVSPLFPNHFLELNSTIGLTASSKTLLVNESVFNAETGSNGASTDNIVYAFANTPGVLKVGTYRGTAAAGNHVSTESKPGKGDGFKPVFLMVKRMTTAGSSWEMYDAARGDAVLFPNTNNAEAATVNVEFVDDGFVWKVTGSGRNALNDEYLFIAIAESGTTANTAFTEYDYATAPDEVTINQDTLISYADGFNANGEINTQELIGSGTTFTVPAGNENKKLYLYKDKAGTYGVTEFRPLEHQDYWGTMSPTSDDLNVRIPARHTDYVSPTGSVSATSEFDATYEAWGLFDQGTSGIGSSGHESSWVSVDGSFNIATGLATHVRGYEEIVYSFNEPRVLDSVQLRDRDHDIQTTTPKHWAVYGSTDGNSANATLLLDVPNDVSAGRNGLRELRSIADTSPWKYLHFRVYSATGTTHGWVSLSEIRYSTYAPSDRYDVIEGKMYSSAGSVISRAYLGEFRTDGSGHVIADTLVNYTPAKHKAVDTEIHGSLIVHEEIVNPGVSIVGCYVDGTQNPPLLISSRNILDVIDTGTGIYELVVGPSIDVNACEAHASANQDNCFIDRNGSQGRLRVALKTTAGGLVDGKFQVTLFGGTK